MKNKKTILKVIEITSSISALTSKVLLALDMILGWPFAVFGYILVTIYNYIRKDILLASTVAGLTFMTAYGWHKWSQDLHGLLLVDYVILGLTGIFALVIYWLKARKGGLMGHLQGLITIFVISAFLLLGYSIFLWGWICLFVSHGMLAYFYNKRKAKYYVTLQIISMGIALVKIIHLL